jgi:hypothetical protein
MHGLSEEQIERQGSDSDNGWWPFSSTPKDPKAETKKDSNDPFLYKLSPLYWTKNDNQKHFIDEQKKAEQDAADQKKYLAKRQEDLKYAEAAAAAKKQAEDVTKQNWAAEAQLKKLKGNVSGVRGTFVDGSFVAGNRHIKLAVPRNRQITAGDFMALVAIVAQQLAGKGKTPTANQIAIAEKIVCKKLAKAHSSVAGGVPKETMAVIKGRLLGNQMAGISPSDSGSFWGHVKDVAKATAPVVLPAAAVAFPVAALTARAIAKGQQQNQKAAPAADTPPADASAPAGPAPATSEAGWFWNKKSMAVPGEGSGTIKMSHQSGKQGYKSFKLPSGWSEVKAYYTTVSGEGVMGFLGFGGKSVTPSDDHPGYVILRHQGKKNSEPLELPDKWLVDLDQNPGNTTLTGNSSSGDDKNKIAERKRLIELIGKSNSDENAANIVYDPGFKDELSNAFDPQLAAVFDQALRGGGSARAEFKKRIKPYLAEIRTQSSGDDSDKVADRKRIIGLIEKSTSDKNARNIVWDPGFKDEISNAFDPQLAAIWPQALRGRGDSDARAEFKKRIKPYLAEIRTQSSGDELTAEEILKRPPDPRIQNSLTARAVDIIRKAKQGDPAANAAFDELMKKAEAKKKAPTVSAGDDSKTVPHTVYRAEICRRAKLLCNGGTPTSACMAKAQASVHAEMRKAGVKVSIPGAKPGRATAGPSSSMMG